MPMKKKPKRGSKRVQAFTRSVPAPSPATPAPPPGRAPANSDGWFWNFFDKGSMPKVLFDAETLRFLKVNRAAVHDYGYSRREFLAMKMTDLLTPEEHPLLLEYQ